MCAIGVLNKDLYADDAVDAALAGGLIRFLPADRGGASSIRDNYILGRKNAARAVIGRLVVADGYECRTRS